ncbi:membrane protein insertion efficiency factor YidD [Candidatus Babeliales bacterium]|nr:membrane protein insertion efficiency factor YidD [Candidatus Babeliales bacterium]MBY0353808.1 membrane protein insertion efficiency factor YidD [Candidatus Babeliales bacterium]
MKLHHRFIIAFFDLIRPFFGYMNVCCIYPFSCSDYAKLTLQETFFPIALIKITLRVLSCNPLTALALRLFSRFN